MSTSIEVTKERFEDIGDTDGGGKVDWCYSGYNYEVTVDGRTFHIRSYDDLPGDAIVGTSRPYTTDRRLRLLVDYLTQDMGFSKVSFYSGRLGCYQQVDLATLEFID